MRMRKNQKGFTLLEIIVVIIIIGVLASLALPRLFATVATSRATEALNVFRELKAAMERCSLNAGGSYVNCNAFPAVGVNDPGAEPNASFGYTFVPIPTATSYTIVATPNANGIAGGLVAGDIIRLKYNRTGVPATDENCVDGAAAGAFAATLTGDCPNNT